jgi:hypothetical protein
MLTTASQAGGAWFGNSTWRDGAMFGRISYTFSLMGASWQVLKKDKELLLLPLLSGICCLLVIASFAIPIVATGHWEPPAADASTSGFVAYYGLLFLFYLCNYFVVIFFNSAVVACAVIRLSGGDPTVADGLRAAGGRLHLIFGWALLSATVGVVLRVIEDRSRLVGRIVVGLLGVAWSLLTYLAVPVLVVEKAGTMETFRRSSSLFKKTWGEQIVGGFAFGLVFFLLALLGAVPVILGFMGGTPVTVGVGIGVAVLYVIILGLVQSVLQSIFQAALYLYARDGEEPAGFAGGLLAGALGSR